MGSKLDRATVLTHCCDPYYANPIIKEAVVFGDLIFFNYIELQYKSF